MLDISVRLACPIAGTYTQLSTLITLPNLIFELSLLHLCLHYSTVSYLRIENLSDSCLYIALAICTVPGTTWCWISVLEWVNEWVWELASLAKAIALILPTSNSPFDAIKDWTFVVYPQNFNRNAVEHSHKTSTVWDMCLILHFSLYGAHQRFWKSNVYLFHRGNFINQGKSLLALAGDIMGS